ncbi:MAG: FAD-binding oxidoreductase [Halobacteria archaeon]|nr:FAD-binding oxidoreductase [Halobacteria archaeon]
MSDYRVLSVEDVGEDTVSLEIESPAELSESASPGQFVEISAEIDGEEVSRYYTISSPYVTESFETTVEVDPEGDLSPYLSAPGDSVSVSVEGPYGSSYYEGEEEVVVLAGGPGVGPAVGVADRAVDDGGSATVVYYDDEPVHRDRLDAVDADEEGRVIYVETDAGFEDAVSDAVGSGSQVFVYGFEEFVEKARRALEDAGYGLDEAKIESFG